MAEDRLNELIKTWLDDGDLIRLEHVVIAGQGHRLLNVHSENKRVQEFLKLIPAYIEKIEKIHETVVQGNVDEVKKILTRKRFALSRNQYGDSPLHLAVLHGHTDVVIYIITQFPETIDGPDNDGRTPFHFAAVYPEKQIYKILKRSGANDKQKDRLGFTPEDYLTNGQLTIKQLLLKFRKRANHRYMNQNDPNQISKEDERKSDIWERPPTAEIISQLTPESSSSLVSVPPENDSLKQDDQQSVQQDGKEIAEDKKEIQILQLEPRTFLREEEDEGSISNRSPNNDPLLPDGISPNELYQFEIRSLKRSDTFDSGSKKKNDKSPTDDKVFEDLNKEFNESIRNEKLRLKESIDSQIENSDLIKSNPAAKAASIIDNEVDRISSSASSLVAPPPPGLKIVNGISTSGFDLTQIKDEYGQTILHLVARKDQKPSTFYKILKQSKYLIPELDSKYRSVRDVAVQNGIKNNLKVIDQFIIDCYLNEDLDYLRILLMDGYKTLLTVVDSEGNDIVSLLHRNNIHKPIMQQFIQEAAEFQVSKSDRNN
ncbi:ankyrin repeat domain containing protein 30 [Sarcoptes scabiei]|uniref:Ankyrin repeat domain containing protein 30 n=1 Tax=Sarcoptes scabiei TaxID=52283 RepID=A0A132AFW0_SARSC|nr:ankyrin repeat domain containing protein 30 [Sarcoptes scabiei]